MFNKEELEQMKEAVQLGLGDALEAVVLPQISELREQMNEMNQRLIWTNAVMVTRDLLEDRFADFRASLNDTATWLGRQFKRLTNIMYQRQILTATEVMQIHAK